MMNKDIRLSIGFLDHPKTIKLKRKLGSDGLESLIRLWFFSAQYKPSGDLNGLEAEDIELAAKWNGEPGVFVETIVALRFLDECDGCYSLHDWREHNGFVAHAEERSEQAKQAANARWDKKKKGACAGSNTDSTADRNAECNAPSPIPFPSPAPSPNPFPNPSPSPVPAPNPPPMGEKDTHCDPCGSVPAAAGERVPGPPAGSANAAIPSCPQQEIIALYHETLPELPGVIEWSTERQKLLRTRWKERKERQDLDWWRRYFLGVRDQPFLMGQGEKAWHADLEWLIRPKNMPKVIDGRYRSRDRPMDGRLSRSGQATYRNMMAILEREKPDDGS